MSTPYPPPQPLPMGYLTTMMAFPSTTSTPTPENATTMASITSMGAAKLLEATAALTEKPLELLNISPTSITNPTATTIPATGAATATATAIAAATSAPSVDVSATNTATSGYSFTTGLSEFLTAVAEAFWSASSSQGGVTNSSNSSTLFNEQLTTSSPEQFTTSSWWELLYTEPVENLTNSASWTQGVYYNLTTVTMNYINSSDIFTADGAVGGGGYGVGAQYRLSPVGGKGLLNDTFLIDGNSTTIGDGSDITGRTHQFHKGCLVFDFLIEAVFMGLLCAFGFTGNTLSMICLWRDKSKTATPFLLVSLELADTLFLVTVLLLRVMTSIHGFTGWLEPVMSVFPYIGSYVYPCALIAETGSIYLTILVTMNRYVSVCRPYEASNLCSIYHARRHVVLVAAFSVIFNLPRFFEYKVVQVPIPGGAVNQTSPRAVMSDMAQNMAYQIVYLNVLYFLVMFAVPLLTLICLNYKLIKALRKTKKKRAQLISSSHIDSQSRSEDDITLVLIVVVIVFVISQTPALITQSLFSFLRTETRVCPNAFFYYERISDLMVVANASMNFIIYCFCSTKFRQILVNLLCKKELDSPEQSENVTRITKIRTAKCARGARDSMV